MKRIMILVLLLLAGTGAVSGQSGNDGEQCPTIAVNGPVTAVKVGGTAAFSVSLSRVAKPRKIKYAWTVKGGALVSGQGTRHVTARIDGDAVATVEIEGLEEGCGNKAEFSLKTGPAKVLPILFDEFGKVKNKLLKKRVAALADALKNNPGAKGYFVSYGPASKVKKREETLRGILTIEGSRVVFVERGVEKKVRTRVWIVPVGADASKLN